MEYPISDRMSALKPSVIREILKYSSDPTVISFSAGNPAPEVFPIQEIAEISAKLLQENPVLALQYNYTEGYPALRNTMKRYMAEKHQSFREEIDELIITTGAQQVMDLATKVLCNEGDVVICEAPSFIGSLNTFRSYNTVLKGVPMDDDGVNLAALEQTMQENPNAKLLYLIPNFQNPSGMTTSLEKRKAIYELAKKYQILILEDNPYGDTRVTGTTIPTIKSMDTEGLVIYAGTFSKVISSGMRVGYAIAPKPVMQKMIVGKQCTDVHTNMWAQVVIDEFINHYGYDKHLEKLAAVYKKKSDLMISKIDACMVPYGVTHTEIEGGLFVWCTLPDNIPMPEFCKKAVERKVCVVPGNAFLTDDSQPCQSFRMNFSTPTDEAIIEGVEILGKLLQELQSAN